jgi:hypothetical protein
MKVVVEVLLAIAYCANAIAVEDVNVMLITSSGGAYNSSGVEPAVDLAIRLINENEVIPGYRINIASRGDSAVGAVFCFVYTWLYLFV